MTLQSTSHYLNHRRLAVDRRGRGSPSQNAAPVLGGLRRKGAHGEEVRPLAPADHRRRAGALFLHLPPSLVGSRPGDGFPVLCGLPRPRLRRDQRALFGHGGGDRYRRGPRRRALRSSAKPAHPAVVHHLGTDRRRHGVADMGSGVHHTLRVPGWIQGPERSGAAAWPSGCVFFTVSPSVGSSSGWVWWPEVRRRRREFRSWFSHSRSSRVRTSPSRPCPAGCRASPAISP